jgi:DNA polymerase-3 subunit delta'
VVAVAGEDAVRRELTNVPAFRARTHPRALAMVRRAIASERPAHALMLVGPRGVGKTTLALDLAAGLLCFADDPNARPCRNCRACRKVDHGTHPDVHRLAPGGAGGQVRLAQVQELQAALSFLPFEGRYRLAIVEGADRLNPDAQNAFLKTLEEPPARVCIILAVEDESLVLPTVTSRCARLNLSPLPRSEVAALLTERGVADPARAAAIARVAHGRPGRALALALDSQAVLVRDRLLRTLLDLVRADRHTRLGAVPALLADGAAIADAIERGAPGDKANRSEPPDSDGSEPSPRSPASRARTRAPAPAERRRAALTVIDAWRQLARDLAVAGRRGRSEIVQVDLLEEIVATGESLDAPALASFLQRLDELDAAVEAYANPELVLDVLLLTWPRPESAG